VVKSKPDVEFSMAYSCFSKPEVVIPQPWINITNVDEICITVDNIGGEMASPRLTTAVV